MKKIVKKLRSFTKMLPKLYSDKTENVKYINITQGAPYRFFVGYSVPISAKAGDIISVSFESEITNPQNYIFQTGRFIVLGNSPTDTAQSKSILPAAGENLLVSVHHQIVSGSTCHEFAEDFDGFVNVVFYAISTSASAAGNQQAILEQNYGRLDVLHFQAAPVVEPPAEEYPAGPITLTTGQVEQIRSALTAGTSEREAALMLLPPV